MKLCSTCKHAERYWRMTIAHHSGDWTQELMLVANPRCRHNDANKDPIYGQPEESCVAARNFGHCGKDGEKWEEFVSPGPKRLISQQPSHEKTKGWWKWWE